MKFYVPTRGRPDCVTPSTLIRYGVPASDILLVVRQEEVGMYAIVGKTEANIVCLPDGIEGLSATRQWIMRELAPRFHCQIDDDIFGFLEKPDPTRWMIRPMATSRFKTLLATFEGWLRNGIVAASTQERMGLAHPTSKGRWTDHTRIGQMIFIDGAMVLKHDWRFDRVPLYADQDMALQIVRDGYVTRVSNRFGHSMRPTRSPGGCNIYRDQDCINKSAEKLCKLHPGLIKLRWRQKGGLMIPSRYIAWRKAREEGEAKRRNSNARSG